ncbi:hypothetical protein GCM10027568_25130 [Humibacter soli]
MTEPIRRAHVANVLPRNQYLVVEEVPSSALRGGRWVDGELGLTEEWLVFATGDPHDAPDFLLLDGGVDAQLLDSAGTGILTVTIARSVYRFRAETASLQPLVDALTRLRGEPPSGTRLWRGDA